MSRAVRFDHYGGVDVLQVVDVDPPVPGPGQLLVRVRAASINPGEAKIREGAMHERFPATFPSGEGSDFAGVVENVGEAVNGFAPGDEVLGFVHTRSSHAELVVAEAAHVVAKPAGVSWEAGGSLYVAGATAYAAVRAVGPSAGETVVVSGAAGGVGSLTVQLARRAGATVIGLASERHHGWLREHGVIPVVYGDGVADRIRRETPGGAVCEAPGERVDAFIDTVGGGYVELALELGVERDRIDTIIDFAAAARHGVKAEGSADASTAAILAELAGLVDRGELEIPIAARYPLEQVRDAFAELEQGHMHGKIVLMP